MKSYMLLILMVLIFLWFAWSKTAFAAENAGHEQHHSVSFSLFSLVRPLGIATLSFVSVTFLTGLFRKKLRQRFLKIHLPLAIISAVLGFAHGLLVLILYS